MSTTIDWPAVIADLAYLLGDVDESHPDSRVPCSQYVLAENLGVARTTIQRWLDGSRPNWDDGELLLERWCKLSTKARAFAPLTKRSLSAAKLR